MLYLNGHPRYYTSPFYVNCGTDNFLQDDVVVYLRLLDIKSMVNLRLNKSRFYPSAIYRDNLNRFILTSILTLHHNDTPYIFLKTP